VIIANGARGLGRIEFRADEPSLTPHAGLAVSGELCRSLRLVELVDAELGAVDRVAPVKQRRRGLSPGALVVAIAEAQATRGRPSPRHSHSHHLAPPLTVTTPARGTQPGLTHRNRSERACQR
jgi:hypothetical protein